MVGAHRERRHAVGGLAWHGLPAAADYELSDAVGPGDPESAAGQSR